MARVELTYLLERLRRSVNHLDRVGTFGSTPVSEGIVRGSIQEIRTTREANRAERSLISSGGKPGSARSAAAPINSALPTAPGREIELDFLRGLAILLVLDFHAPIHWMSFPLHLLGFPNFGWAGVDIFFILSGFLVGGLLMREWRTTRSIDHRRFLIRRGFKIWPQYYVFLAVMLLTGHRSLHDLTGNLLNVQNYTGGIPHTWSLAVEEHAYLGLTLALVVAARLRLRMRSLLLFFGAIALAVPLLRLYLALHGHEVANRTHTRVDGIALGVILAVVFHFAPAAFRRAQRARLVWFLLAAASLLFLRFQTDAPWSASLGWTAADLLGIALLMLLYRPASFGDLPIRPSAKSGASDARSRPYRLIAWIGVYSYGIYLWHVSVIAPSVALAARLPHALASTWLALAPIVGGIALGALFTAIVELPALRLRDRLFPRRSGPPIPTPAPSQTIHDHSRAEPAPLGLKA